MLKMPYRIPIFVLCELRKDVLLRYILELHPELGDKKAFSWVCEAPWKWDTFGPDPYDWILLFLLAVTLQEYPYEGVFSSEEELIEHIASQPWTHHPYPTESEDVFDWFVDGIQYAMKRCEVHDIDGTVVYYYNKRLYPDEKYFMWNDNSMLWNLRNLKSKRTKLLLLQIVTASNVWEKAMKELWLDNEKEWRKHLGVRVTRDERESVADWIVCEMKNRSLQINDDSIIV